MLSRKKQPSKVGYLDRSVLQAADKLQLIERSRKEFEPRGPSGGTFDEAV
jgi:hypothetical protein